MQHVTECWAWLHSGEHGRHQVHKGLGYSQHVLLSMTAGGMSTSLVVSLWLHRPCFRVALRQGCSAGNPLAICYQWMGRFDR